MLCNILVFIALIIILYKVTEHYFRKKKVNNIIHRRVLITGCDSGFGFSLAKCLDDIGIPVFGACLTRIGEENIRSVCSSRLKTLHLDVTDEQSIAKAVQCVESNLPKGQGNFISYFIVIVTKFRFSINVLYQSFAKQWILFTGLWGLVNNAGLQVISAPLELQSQAAIEKTIQVNLLGVIYVTKAFLPLLRESKGRIVSVSSDAALIAWPCRVAYNISKCGVESMSSCLR